jgi:hypothetical protein
MATLREINAELLVRLAACEQAGDMAGAAKVRDELFEANGELVKPLATWLKRHWKWGPPPPLVEELVHLGNVRLWKVCRKIKPHNVAKPTQYLRKAIYRGMKKRAKREHITGCLPEVTDGNGKKHRLGDGIRQLETGQRGKKGDIEWGGYDGIIVPLYAEDTGMQPRTTVETRRRRSQRGLEHPDGRRAVPESNQALAETEEALRYVCKANKTLSQVVELLIAGKKWRAIARALGVKSLSTVQNYVERIRTLYEKHMADIENPPTTRRTNRN